MKNKLEEEITTTLDKDSLKSYLLLIRNNYYFSKFYKFLKRAGVFILVISFVFISANMLIKEDYSFRKIVLLLCILYFPLLYYFSPRISLFFQKECVNKKFIYTFFEENYFILKNDDFESKIQWTAIKFIKEDTHYFFLFVSKRQGHIIKKSDMNEVQINFLEKKMKEKNSSL